MARQEVTFLLAFIDDNRQLGQLEYKHALPVEYFAPAPSAELESQVKGEIEGIFDQHYPALRAAVAKKCLDCPNATEGILESFAAKKLSGQEPSVHVVSIPACGEASCRTRLQPLQDAMFDGRGVMREILKACGFCYRMDAEKLCARCKFGIAEENASGCIGREDTKPYAQFRSVLDR